MSVLSIAHDLHDYNLPEGGGLPTHHKILKDFPGILDVVAVISNPHRYRSRYDLYRAFERHVNCSGARLTTVELAFGERPWEITTPENPRNIQLRTNFELWYKENLINIGVTKLPRDWKYVAWIDADLLFIRPDWVQETLHQLQHYSIIQLFSQIIEVTELYEPYDTGMGLIKHGFAAAYQRALRSGLLDSAVLPGVLVKPINPDNARLIPGKGIGRGGVKILPYGGEIPGPVKEFLHEYWHPGFAWAMRRDTWEAMGGLIDFAILGAADHHMSWAMLGYGVESVHGKMSQQYKDMVKTWQDYALENIKGNIGYVPGIIVHYWHGQKTLRRYWDRWDILIRAQYNPLLDIKRDWQGLWQLTGKNQALRDGIRDYFKQRDEDAPYTPLPEPTHR